MLFKDFCQYFYAITVNYTKDNFFHTRISEQIADEEWGVAKLVIPKNTKLAFLSIFQMNQKFFDPEEDAMDIVATQEVSAAGGLAAALAGGLINEEVNEQNEATNASDAFKDKGQGVLKPPAPEGETDQKSAFAKKDLEYPKLELMICKRGKLKPKEGEKPTDDEVIAYLDGTEGCLPCLTLRLNDMKAGEYYVLYRPDFKDYHKVRRLNIVFYSEFFQKKKGEELREWEKEQEEKSKNPEAAAGAGSKGL